MTGDFYRSIQYPNIDRANGGSLQGMLDGLGDIIGRAGPNTKIIPGHGPTVTADGGRHASRHDAHRSRSDREAGRHGKSEDEAVAAKCWRISTRKVEQVGTTGDRFVRQVYAELKATR